MRTLTLKTYAVVWLLVAVGALVWLMWQFFTINQTDSANLGLELVVLIIGLPAVVVGALALVILKAKTASLQRTAIVAVALIPSLLLIGRPIIGGVALTAMVAALWATRRHIKSAKPRTYNSSK